MLGCGGKFRYNRYFLYSKTLIFNERGKAMARISLKENSELPPEVLAQVEAVETAGGDTSIMRGIAHRQELFSSFFKWYHHARKEEAVEEELIELVRLKVARLNNCFT